MKLLLELMKWAEAIASDEGIEATVELVVISSTITSLSELV